MSEQVREMELDPELDGRKLSFLTAMLTSKSIAEAAKSVDVPAPTAYRWLQDPAFAAILHRMRGEAISGATTTLAGAAMAFALTLREIAEDQTAPAAVRVSAAAKGLDLALKGHETEDLRAQVAELAEKLRALTAPPSAPVN